MKTFTSTLLFIFMSIFIGLAQAAVTSYDDNGNLIYTTEQPVYVNPYNNQYLYNQGNLNPSYYQLNNGYQGYGNIPYQYNTSGTACVTVNGNLYCRYQ